MGRTYAGILGTLAFSTTVARTVLQGGSPESGLAWASGSLFAFAALGFVAGWLAESVVRQSIRARMLAFRQRPDDVPGAAT